MTLALAVLGATLIQMNAAYAYSDVPSSYWDYTAITYVASTNPWMQDYGATTFKPTTGESRKYLARALVLAFKPSESIDPSIHFADLPDTDPYYKYANIATKLGWMPKYKSGNWAPNGAVTVSLFDQAIIMAMGNLGTAISGLQGIHRTGGTKYTVGTRFPYLILAHYLGLHYNHSDESLDLMASTAIRRDEVAYSLWKSKNLYSYLVPNANTRYAKVELPALDTGVQAQADKAAVTQYALNQVGFPYIWAGEWNKPSPSGYCCGTQLQGGFDCSGFVWWTVKKYEDGYNSAQYRSYPGWSLHERSSSQMAQYTTSPVTWGNLRIGDLMFFASKGGSTYSDVDHVGIWLGNNWLIHSASSNDGVVLDYVASGWYYDNFVYGRRLIGGGSSKASLAAAPKAWLTMGDKK